MRKFPVHKNILKSLAPFVLVISLVLLVFAVWKNSQSNRLNMGSDKLQPGQSKVDLSPPTDEEKQAGNSQKNNLNTATSEAQATSSIQITNIIQDESKQVIVQTELHGNGWSRCILTVSKNSQSFIREADVIFQPDFSSCMGFAIPAGDFSSEGQWQFSLRGRKSDGTSIDTEKSFYVTR